MAHAVRDWVNQTEPDKDDTSSTISSIDTTLSIARTGTYTLVLELSCTLYYIFILETTAPYAASEHQVENDGNACTSYQPLLSFNDFIFPIAASFNLGVNELVINQQREKSQQSQAGISAIVLLYTSI